MIRDGIDWNSVAPPTVGNNEWSDERETAAARGKDRAGSDTEEKADEVELEQTKALTKQIRPIDLGRKASLEAWPRTCAVELSQYGDVRTCRNNPRAYAKAKAILGWLRKEGDYEHFQ